MNLPQYIDDYFYYGSIYLCFMKKDNKIFMRFSRLLNKQQQKYIKL